MRQPVPHDAFDSQGFFPGQSLKRTYKPDLIAELSHQVTRSIIPDESPEAAQMFLTEVAQVPSNQPKDDRPTPSKKKAAPETKKGSLNYFFANADEIQARRREKEEERQEVAEITKRKKMFLLDDEEEMDEEQASIMASDTGLGSLTEPATPSGFLAETADDEDNIVIKAKRPKNIFLEEEAEEEDDEFFGIAGRDEDDDDENAEINKDLLGMVVADSDVKMDEIREEEVIDLHRYS